MYDADDWRPIIFPTSSESESILSYRSVYSTGNRVIVKYHPTKIEMTPSNKQRLLQLKFEKVQYTGLYYKFNITFLLFLSEEFCTFLKYFKIIKKMEINLLKAADCPVNIGGLSSCGRITDQVSCYCATFTNVIFDKYLMFKKCIYIFNNHVYFACIFLQRRELGMPPECFATKMGWGLLPSKVMPRIKPSGTPGEDKERVYYIYKHFNKTLFK